MEFISPRDKELTARGWSRKFAASEPRLSEAAHEYKLLGFEVLFEPVGIDPGSGLAMLEDQGCLACLTENSNPMKVIYTRPIME